MFGGMPARNGVTAALLVQAGWNGVDDVFSGEDNFFAVNAPDGDPALLVDGARRALRDRQHRHQEVDGRHADPGAARRHRELCARSTRSPPDDVASVVVRLAPTVGAVVDNRDIPDICLQHMVAVMLIDKTASFHAAHDKPRMQDAAVLRQRAKVKYAPDEALAELLPVRVAIVEIDAERRHAARRNASRPCAAPRAIR